MIDIKKTYSAFHKHKNIQYSQIQMLHEWQYAFRYILDYRETLKMHINEIIIFLSKPIVTFVQAQY